MSPPKDGEMSSKNKRFPYSMSMPKKNESLAYDSAHNSSLNVSQDDYGQLSPFTESAPNANHSLAPSEDPQAYLSGTRAAFDQSYFNTTAHDQNAIAPFASSSYRPPTSRTNTSDSHDNDIDARRPSATSGTTGGSMASQESSRKPGKFRRKNLKAVLGDDPDKSDSQPNSVDANGVEPERSNKRNDSIQTTKSVEEKDPVPQPSSDITPWDYQNFEDVSNFGSAPIRTELQTEPNGKVDSNGSAATSSKKSLLHRHAKSKDDSHKPSVSRQSPMSKRPATSREASDSNNSLPFLKGLPQNSTPMSSTANLNGRKSSPSGMDLGDTDTNSGKRSFLSRVIHRHKDKHSPAEQQPRSSPAESIRSVESPQPPRKRAFSKEKKAGDSPLDRDRETSVASADSASTVKPEPFPKMERTYTASSKIADRFHRHGKNRGLSYQNDSPNEKSQAGRQKGTAVQQAPTPAGIFSLDTNFDDLSDIIRQSPHTEAGKLAPTPSQELNAPAWDAPDSWAVKGAVEESTINFPEDKEDGLAPIDEEQKDSRTYFMRVFRVDGTYATLSMNINATVGEVMQSLARKTVIPDAIENYHLLLRKNQLSRQLDTNERPIAMQKRLLLQAGYEEQDDIASVGKDDHSYLCRFNFSHEKQTGYGSGLENDPVFNKMQKFSHVDLSGRSLVTIPIVMYTRAPEIISLNLSRNLGLAVPKDFVTACINLREIKFTGNEARRLPASIAFATRMTILDLSNNRLEQLEHAELHRAVALVSLKLANNLLGDLPTNFSMFRQLRSLNISSNSFKTLPEHICNLKSLVDLDISFNKISTLPAKISSLTTLERLWMTNNDLKGPLPDSLKSLTNLKEIDARFNGITNVNSVTDLPNLEQLMVGHNSITTFKGSFQKLRNLVLDHCPMTQFEIDSMMPTLAFLNIASANLCAFEARMFELMPNLQKLNLDKNLFTEMSSQIGRLQRLEYLSMAKNKLNSVTPTIGNLSELKFLNLRENNIKSLPPEIWFCRKLETLILSSNLMETFPRVGAAPEPKMGDLPPTPGLSQSPSFEELGKLEDFQARRPSQASAGVLSVGSSPGGSHRKNSITSLHAPNRKMSQISRANTDISMGAVNRKDSNLSTAKHQNTFAASLRYLYLADNRLDDEIFRELRYLTELRMLNVAYNEIDDFPQGCLRLWPQIQELYLSGNLLTSLPSDDLEESSNLRMLFLNGNRFQVLPAELCNVHKLSVLDVGSNALKYNVSNWPYDWNWNRNTNLKYLNFSANKRLEIKPATHPTQQQMNAFGGSQVQDLTSFNVLKYLRVLGLMDVTLLTNSIPDDNEDRRVRTSASLAGALFYGMADTLGKNDHLATLDLLKPNFRGHEAEVVVGMFDGQTMSTGGSKIAKYLHEHFSQSFMAQLNKAEELGDDPGDALRRTFLSLNKDMANFANSNIDTKEHRVANNAHRGSVVANSLTQDDFTTGAVATILYLNGTELHVANVGDIEAIIVTSNAQHRLLTTKHDPAEARERERIRGAGGYVSRQGKLNDVLEVSRAFGYFQHMPSIIAAPDVVKIQLTDGDELIILATKEFWDYVVPDLAVDIARKEKGDLMYAAQKLRDLAIAYGARDKIMVMVLGVSDLRRRNNSRFRGTSLSMAKELGQDDGQIFPSSRKTRRKGETLVGDAKLARLEEVEAPVGDVAIVFTDIKNSTALWELFAVPMRSAISMHNELMRRQLRIIGGYEVKTEGDAFMCSFPTATSALLWCFSCQSHLLDLPWPTEILDSVHCQEKVDADQNMIYRGLSVRMGIHWGNPVCEQDPITRRMDYFGPMVNKSARVSAVADGGQIAVSTDFVNEIMKCLQFTPDDDRRDSTGSQDTTTADDPMADRIRRELRQLSSQGFEVKELGEKKLKGLENPEFIYLMYPHSLVGRLNIPPGGPEKPSVSASAGESADGGQSLQPGTLDQHSLLSTDGLDLEEVWKLWDIALRLEMLCSCLESPDRDIGLRKPEMSLLNRMKERGGVLSDAFMMNLLEHQVTRVESSITTLQLRHLLSPFQRGMNMGDHAVPIRDVMTQVSEALKILNKHKSQGHVLGEVR